MDVATPQKLCECGCGEPAPLAKQNDTSRGHVKGQPKRFIHGHNGNLRKTFECSHGHGALTERNRKSRASGRSLYCRECARLGHARVRFKRDYGITSEEYDALWLAQNGLCAICENPETQERNGKPKALAVDHNHGTGKVRSLLCGSCNVAIGHLREDPVLVRKVADYLEDHA